MKAETVGDCVWATNRLVDFTADDIIDAHDIPLTVPEAEILTRIKSATTLEEMKRLCRENASSMTNALKRVAIRKMVDLLPDE